MYRTAARAPPCAPRGKSCGIELHLEQIVELTHRTRDQAMDLYIEHFHEDVCALRKPNHGSMPLSIGPFAATGH